MDIGWPEIAIIAVVVLVLFGSKKLPDAARSLGRSMRILKTEIKDLHTDEPAAPAPPAEIAATPTTTASAEHATVGDQQSS
jgi:sec-independent protein translocase protein TatA